MSKSKQKKQQQGGITIDEFADHFAEMFLAIDRGEVRGIAMAVVTADSPNASELSSMASTLSKDGVVALVLRDTTNDLWDECEKQVHDEMIVPCLKQPDASGTVK